MCLSCKLFILKLSLRLLSYCCLKFLPRTTPAATGEGETSATARAPATSKTKEQKPPTIAAVLPTLTRTAGPILQLAGRVQLEPPPIQIKGSIRRSKTESASQKTDTPTQGNGTCHSFPFQTVSVLCNNTVPYHCNCHGFLLQNPVVCWLGEIIRILCNHSGEPISVW
ncbi:hypothetical protein JRQ81_016587 [Phrynocephalus forsythii]|uniref:Uncharacterized protein n=1 Tax=Phrynocephalus forsythii TaxID=171643 RepID=A0A9Q1B119_9SAUR|nr:hypothetical protein JRQ81_016587 [Phrynocephalus forsythii]